MASLVEYFGREIFDQIFYSIITLLIVVAAYFDLRDKNYPPGPMGMPFFGYLPMLNPKTPYNTLKELASHYGKVFSIYLGSTYAVCISDVKLIREAFNKDTFHEQVPLMLANAATRGKGILMADSQRWKQHRFFLSSTLKNLGNSRAKSPKVILEDKIHAALSEFLQDIKQFSSSGADVKPALQHSIGSLMVDVVTGMRPMKDDHNWERMQTVFTSQLQMMSITSSLNFVPLLKNFSKFPRAMGNLMRGRDETSELYRECEHKYKNADAKDMSSVVEAYLSEMKRRQGNKDDSLSPDQIYQVLSDILAMGMETTMHSVHWLFIYLAMYPEVQEYIFKELEHAFGSKKENLTLEDCKKLTYAEAVIMEVWRHRPVLPLGLPHCASENTKIGNYWIREGTLVVPLIYAVHRDQRYWDKPDEFIPERHLNDDGSIRKSDYFIPFQTGQKACIGEELAQWTVVLFLAGVMNHFKVSFAKGIKYSHDDLPDFKITSAPPPYRLIFEARH